MLVACATPTVAAVLLGAQSQVFRGGVETVEVTVIDADDRLVTGLSKDDSWSPRIGGGAQAMTHFTDARGNLFGHSAPDVLGRLAQSGATILRTDRPGHIQI